MSNQKLEQFKQYMKTIKNNKKLGLWFDNDTKSISIVEWHDEDRDKTMVTLHHLVKGYFTVLTRDIAGKRYHIYCHEDGRILYEKNILVSEMINEDVFGNCFIIYDSSCNACGNDIALKKCTGCKKKRYCNRECQKDDWEFHKEFCN